MKRSHLILPNAATYMECRIDLHFPSLSLSFIMESVLGKVFYFKSNRSNKIYTYERKNNIWLHFQPLSNCSCSPQPAVRTLLFPRVNLDYLTFSFPGVKWVLCKMGGPGFMLKYFYFMWLRLLF